MLGLRPTVRITVSIPSKRVPLESFTLWEEGSASSTEVWVWIFIPKPFRDLSKRRTMSGERFFTAGRIFLSSSIRCISSTP